MLGTIDLLRFPLSVGQVNYPKVFDEDSGDALSPEQPASQESHTSAPSPGESRAPEASPPAVVPPPPPPQPSALLQVEPSVCVMP